MSDCMPSARISVCIVTYKRPRGLRATLDSIENQVFVKSKSIQVTVVVIDNDSAGDACRYCQGICADYRWPLIWTMEPIRGISQARNKAVALGRLSGDYIAFIDDDEVADECWLDELYSTMEKYRMGIVVGRVVPIYPKEIQAWIVKGGYFERGRLETGRMIAADDARTGNVLFDKRILGEEVAPFNVTFSLTGGEDTLFFLKLNIAGKRVIGCDEAIVYETVPKSKITTRYILSRNYLGGLNYTRALFILGPSMTIVLLRLFKAIYRIMVGLLQTIFLGIRGKHILVQGLCNIAVGIGTISAFWGYKYDAYRQVHGE